LQKLMGCGSSKAEGEGQRPNFTDPKDPLRPSACFRCVIDDDVNERERLLQKDDIETEERVQKYGLALCVHEAIIQQKAKMLMLQIIMKFQEALIIRRRLSRAIFERWRYVVICRRSGVDAGTWAPPRANRGAARAMRKREVECEGYVIEEVNSNKTKDADGEKRRRKKNPKDVDAEEMKHLIKLKDNDLMRVVEMERQEAEARGQNFDIKKFLLGAKTSHERVCQCCKSNCVII